MVTNSAILNRLCDSANIVFQWGVAIQELQPGKIVKGLKTWVECVRS